MSTSGDKAVDWATDIIRTADELGYDVASIAPEEVRLYPRDMGKGVPAVTLDGGYITGRSLRRILAPAEPQPAELPERITL